MLYCTIFAMRLFAAVWPTDDALERCLAAQQELIFGIEGKASWTKRERMHITLRFFGTDFDPAIAHREVEAAIAGVQPFEVVLHKLGGFSSAKRARVAFLEPQRPSALDEIAKRLAAEGERDPQPHLTLARFPVPQKLPLLTFEPIAFPVGRVALVRSILAGANPRYEEVYSWELPRPPAENKE